MIPYGRQEVTQADIEAVIQVLHSDFLTQGPQVPRFEGAVASYCGAKNAVAVNSATSALHIACLALGLGAGDYLWTSPITFVASANCARYCGADVDFVDIDPLTFNISVDALRKKLEHAESSGKLPKIVVPVHMAGQPCDMRAIHALSQKYGFRIIEDASHAIGAKYLEKPVGNCRYSDITVFSFHPVKIITSAEGGMALTNDPVLAKRMELLRSHGITKDIGDMPLPYQGPWHYQQVDLGFNYRMTDIQAALGLSQLSRLDEYVAKRHGIASKYNDALKNLPVSLPELSLDSHSSLHLYIVKLHDKNLRARVFSQLREQGIGVNVHYIPVHLQPYYLELGFCEGMFPMAEAYYSQALTLPLFPSLDHESFNHVLVALKAALD